MTKENDPRLPGFFCHLIVSKKNPVHSPKTMASVLVAFLSFLADDFSLFFLLALLTLQMVKRLPVDFRSFLESPAEAADTAATVPAVIAASPEAAPAPGEGGAIDRPLARVTGDLELVPLRLEPWGQVRQRNALISKQPRSFFQPQIPRSQLTHARLNFKGVQPGTKRDRRDSTKNTETRHQTRLLTSAWGSLGIQYKQER